MTKEEKLEILADAESRCYEALKTAAVGSEMRDVLKDLFEISLLREEDDEQNAPAPAEQSDSPKPAPVPETEQTTTPSPSPAKEDKPEQPTMTKAEMVSKLTAFQTNGVAIDKVMESMGYTKLSQVPANQYEKLLELCQKALDGEG